MGKRTLARPLKASKGLKIMTNQTTTSAQAKKIAKLIDTIRNGVFSRKASRNTMDRAQKKLTAIGASALPALIAFVQDENEDINKRWVVVNALCDMGEVAAPALDTIVTMSTQRKIATTFYADIGKIGTASYAYIPQLIEAFLSAPNSIYVNCGIMWSLASTKHASVTAFLLKVLKDDSIATQWHAVQCLQAFEINTPEVLEALKIAHQSENMEVSLAAWFALQELAKINSA